MEPLVVSNVEPSGGESNESVPFDKLRACPERSEWGERYRVVEEEGD